MHVHRDVISYGNKQKMRLGTRSFVKASVVIIISIIALACGLINLYWISETQVRKWLGRVPYSASPQSVISSLKASGANFAEPLEAVPSRGTYEGVIYPYRDSRFNVILDGYNTFLLRDTRYYVIFHFDVHGQMISYEVESKSYE